MKGQAFPKWEPFDVIKGIFAYLPQRDSIPSSIPRLHEIVYNLAKRRDYKNFLQNYIFDYQSYFPYSREFQTDLINLQQAGLLESPNPDFRNYNIKERLKTTFKANAKEKFSDAEILLLQKMSKDFHKELSK